MNVDPDLEQYLDAVWQRNASDLLLVGGAQPRLRIDGELHAIVDAPRADGPMIRRFVDSLLDDDQRAVFHHARQVDFSFSWKQHGRFRANAYHQRGWPAVALRTIPDKIRPLADLGAPTSVQRLLEQPYGIVLVTGPTGSGKSTTLAAMIDAINKSRAVHILTIEDPIEFLHRHQVATVSQREVGTDTPTFADGLRAALREDPDVILVGEMRDLESIAIALTLAETGHLVFGTLHTNDAPQAIDRIVDVFPGDRREQIQVQLASALQGVVGQRLVPKIGGGRVAGYEVLVATEAVRNLVREGKTRQLRNILATGRGEGMQTLEQDLARLIATGQITKADARHVAAYPKELDNGANAGTASAAAQATAHPAPTGTRPPSTTMRPIPTATPAAPVPPQRSGLFGRR